MQNHHIKGDTMKQLKKFFAAALSVMLLLLALPLPAFAQTESFEISEFDYGYWGPQDTPLLVILVNIDPGLNGENFETDETMLRQKDHSYWSEMFFGDGPKGLKAYFETQSGGKFRFTPAQESFADASKNNKANDGIVEVSVNTSIPASTKTSTSDPERYAALAAAVTKGYVDFSVYDKNKDGTVTEKELVVAFIVAGYEATRSSSTPSYNAHKSSFSYGFNGITVKTDYVKCGEMIKASVPLTVGSFCHELGHVLGNGDLYAAGATEPWGGANSPAGKVSVMAGNGSAGKNDGETTGKSPSNFDPYHLTVYGLYDYTNVMDGTYTLYSRQSEKGTYNILKVSSPNPMEYYLIENRYFDNSSEHFDSDTNYEGTRGILIWHVDQSIADSGRNGPGMRINSKGTNPDIGVAALAAVKTSVDDGGTPHHAATSGVFNKAGLVFNCHDYFFPGSGTWHTGLTPEEAANFNLKIEILDDPGHEMQIRITGAPNAAPRYQCFTKTGDSSISVYGQITDLNSQTLTSLTLSISKSEDFSNATDVALTPGVDGSFSHVFENLELGNYYYTKLTFGTKNGDFTDTEKTLLFKPVEKDPTKYNISLFRGISEKDKAFGVTGKVGEPVVLKFPMVKKGYAFAGWYLDPEFTQWYDISVPKANNEDITLYAKWVPEDTVAKLNVHGATLVNTKINAFGCGIIGETFREPTVVLQEGERVLWFADAAHTIPFDFTKPIANGDDVSIYAVILKEEPDSEETRDTTATIDPDQIPHENKNGNIFTVILIAAALILIVIAFLSLGFVWMKKRK